MFQLTRDSIERANRSSARVFASQPSVVDAATAWPATTVLASNPTAPAYTTPMTNVHTTAICTFGKRYERRLQELPT